MTGEDGFVACVVDDARGGRIGGAEGLREVVPEGVKERRRGDGGERREERERGEGERRGERGEGRGRIRNINL